MESTNRRLMWHGMCLFLLGLPDSPVTASYGRPVICITALCRYLKVA